MKNLLPVLIFLLIGSHVNGQTKQEQEVLQLSKQKFRWLINKNIDSLKSILDDRLSFTHSNGWMQTKQELIDDLSSGKLTYLSVDVSQASVRMYPKSAVVTGRAKFTTSVDGNPSITIELAYSETYVLQKKDWKLASRHASRIQ